MGSNLGGANLILFLLKMGMAWIWKGGKNSRSLGKPI